MSLIPAPGAKVVTAKYIGDGTFDRIIPLSITPRKIVIMEEAHNSTIAERWDGDLTEGVVYWNQGAAFRVLTAALDPLFFPLVNKGFNVGKAHNWNNVANGIGVNLLLIAI